MNFRRLLFALAAPALFFAVLPVHSQKPVSPELEHVDPSQIDPPQAAENWPSKDPSAHDGYLMDGDAYILEGGGPLTKPRLLSGKSPRFPPGGTIEGICRLSVIVEANGKPGAIQVARTLRADYDEKAIKAVRKYRFAPGTLEGKPVEVRIYVEINFTVDDDT